jgi:uncharacterized Zn-finger protein
MMIHVHPQDNKRFATSSQLNIHKRIHSKQKPFACDQCQMTFTQLCSLKRHRQLHTGEKLFSCDVCPFKCTQSHHLKRHKRIHSGEKPFPSSNFILIKTLRPSEKIQKSENLNSENHYKYTLAKVFADLL